MYPDEGAVATVTTSHSRQSVLVITSLLGEAQMVVCN